MYTAVHWQNALNFISEIVEGCNFSDTAYNCTYVSDVQSLIAKSSRLISSAQHYVKLSDSASAIKRI